MHHLVALTSEQTERRRAARDQRRRAYDSKAEWAPLESSAVEMYDSASDLPFIFAGYRGSEASVRAWVTRCIAAGFAHGGQLREAFRDLCPEHAWKADDVLEALIVRGLVRPVAFTPSDPYSMTSGINYGPTSPHWACWSFEPCEGASGAFEVVPLGDELRTAEYLGRMLGQSWKAREEERAARRLRDAVLDAIHELADQAIEQGRGVLVSEMLEYVHAYSEWSDVTDAEVRRVVDRLKLEVECEDAAPVKRRRAAAPIKQRRAA